MALGARQFVVVLAIGALGALALLAASPAAASASAGACNKWGEKQPGKIAKGQARKAVLCLVNRERKSHNVGKIDRNKKLQKAAQRHTEKMVGTGCFSHECPGEGDLTRRLQNVNYLSSGLDRWIYAENVAWGGGHLGTPKAIVNAWMNSPPHRANILDRRFRDIGVGVEPGTPKSRKDSGGVYTIDFGLAVR